MGIEEELPMERRTKQLLAAVGAAAAILLAVGLVAQDWGSPATEVAPGNPWGTLITGCVLSAEAALMAGTAPKGPDSIRNPFIAAFVVDSVGWLLTVFLYQQFSPVDEGAQHWLSIVAGACIGLAGIWFLYVAVAAAGKGGHLSKWPDKLGEQTFLQGLFGAWSLVFILTVAGVLPLPTILSQALVGVLLVVVGFTAKQRGWASAVLVTFIMAIVLQSVNPSPFRTSRLFGTVALVNVVFMLRLASIYGLAQAIVATISSAYSMFDNNRIDMTMPVVGGDSTKTQAFDMGQYKPDISRFKPKEKRMCDKPENWYKNCMG